MSSRPSAPKAAPTSSFDVEGFRSGDDLGPELVRPVGGWPEIGPPLLLEPVPPPIVLARPDPSPTDPEPVVDAYALAAATASAMEREGRTFDTPSELPDVVAGDAAEALDAVAVAVADTPEDEELVRFRSEPKRRTTTRTEPASRPAPTSPARRKKRRSSKLLGLVAGLSIAALVLAVVALVLVTSGAAGGGGDVLRPVSHDLDALAGARGRSKFARPPEAQAGAQLAGTVRPLPIVRGAPGTSVVHVDSTPPGAIVRVDGRVRGRTPLDLDLAFGAYSADLQLDGHASFHQILTVDQPKQELTATLAPDLAWGRVRIVADGWQGAELLLDGRSVGKLPITVELKPGTHTFLLTRGNDRLEVRRKVLVSRDRLLEVDLGN